MTGKWAVAALALAIGLWGCGDKSEPPATSAPSGEKKAAASADKKGEEPAGEMTVKIEPAKATVKIGQELELKGFLLNKPKKVSRWELATSWLFGDGKKKVWRPDDKAVDIRTVVKHAWAKAGTYEVTLEFWKGNDKLIEGKAEVIVE